MFGRARTGLYMPAYHVREGENPYEVEIRLIDDLRAGDVAVIACGGPTDRIARWGELLSTASVCRGATGCALCIEEDGTKKGIAPGIESVLDADATSPSVNDAAWALGVGSFGSRVPSIQLK